MTDWPTLFKGQLILAIREGRKTQTRRILKPSNTLFNGYSWDAEVKKDLGQFNWDAAWVDPGPSPVGNLGPYLRLPWPSHDDAVHRIYPKVQSGDILWVKEPWRTLRNYDDLPPSEIGAGAPIQFKVDVGHQDLSGRFGRWRSPLHMPRSVCRMELQVERVRIERLQDISEDDAKTEGLIPIPNNADCYRWDVEGDYRREFATFWDLINGSDNFSWNANPWVIAYDFQRVF